MGMGTALGDAETLDSAALAAVIRGGIEQMLADEGTTIIKLFLHISKEEQKARFESDRERRRAVGQPAHAIDERLLAALAEAPGRVFTRMQLLDAVQGEAYDGYERTIDAHVKNLRQKLEPDPKQPRYLLTVYGVGYKVAD